MSTLRFDVARISNPGKHLGSDESFNLSGNNRMAATTTNPKESQSKKNPSGKKKINRFH